MTSVYSEKVSVLDDSSLSQHTHTHTHTRTHAQVSARVYRRLASQLGSVQARSAATVAAMKPYTIDLIAYTQSTLLAEGLDDDEVIDDLGTDQGVPTPLAPATPSVSANDPEPTPLPMAHRVSRAAMHLVRRGLRQARKKAAVVGQAVRDVEIRARAAGVTSTALVIDRGL